MRLLREWTARVIGMLLRRRRDEDMEEELRLHLELAADEARRSGEPLRQAERTAGIRAGHVAQAMDSMRDQRGVPWLEDLARDVRHGIRSLRRTPAFACVAIVTLGLGIGANTAILSIVTGVVLRPLAYSHPEELMYLATRWGGPDDVPVSVAEYEEFQQFNQSFADVGAFRTGEANVGIGDRVRRVQSAFVDVHLLNALGVHPIEGRLFAARDSVVSGPRLPGGSAVTAPVALISYELWQSLLGAQSIEGRRIDVDGRRVEVAGVLAPGVDLMDTHTDVWLPLGFADGERAARNNHNLTLIGRLKPDVTAAAARTELDALNATWAARAGITPGEGHPGHVFLPARGGEGHVLQMTPLSDQILGRAGQVIWVLQAAVGLVLLIACANVANLLLARGETRHREFALLTALGASRGRLVRKALTESVVLSGAGAALGVLLARVGTAALIRAYPSSLPRIGDVTVNGQVMVVSLAIAVLCGVIVGLVPLMHTRTGDTASTLASGARGTSAVLRHRLRDALVVAEIALAILVVVGAGLLVRTVRNLTVVDVGFDRARLVTFSVTLPRGSFDQLGRVRAYQQLVEQLREVPGVQSASGMTGLPLDRPVISNQTEMANSSAPMASIAPLDYQRVMTGFFETTGIPIVRGRGFLPTDAVSTGGVTVVNETLANTYWKGLDPIGQRLRPGGTMPWYTVIGVVKDVKQTGVDQPVRAEAYMLVDQLATDAPVNFLGVTPTTIHAMVKTTLPLTTLTPTFTQIVRGIDPGVPVARLREMDDVFTESIRRPRLLADLLTAFSALALVLAAIGTYGVIASLVAARRRELGIRLAIGAERRQILGLVMTEGLRLAGGGVVFGLAGTLMVTRVIESQLFGVGPMDPPTLAAVSALIICVAAAACGLPAWRASRVNPSIVLRAE